jgi:hypothetical protein
MIASTAARKTPLGDGATTLGGVSRALPGAAFPENYWDAAPDQQRVFFLLNKIGR